MSDLSGWCVMRTDAGGGEGTVVEALAIRSESI